MKKVSALGSTPWLRPPEAAEYLRVSESLILKLIGERTIPSYGLARNATLVKKADLDAYVEGFRRETV